MRPHSVPLALVLLLALAVPGTAYPRPGTIERLSVSPTGGEGDLHSTHASMTHDARLVAFGSQSPLVSEDTNAAEDVYLRDRTTGELARASVSAAGIEGNDTSYGPQITPDGRFVAFTSHASNLVPNDTNAVADIFVKDLANGAVERVSVSSAEVQALRRSSDPAISADGRHVAFISGANNLVPGDTNGYCDPDNSQGCDVFVRDRLTGTTERVSVAADGTQGSGPSGWRLDISADGRYVSFYSFAPNFVPRDTNGRPDIFVKDRQTGSIERVSVASDGTETDAGSTDAALSADGRIVAFSSFGANLVPGDSTIWKDVFVHERDTGRTERVSVSSTGAEGNSDSSLSDISPDGRYVLYSSTATNLTPGNPGGYVQVFLHDRLGRTTEVISADADGLPGDGSSVGSSIGPGGRVILFDGRAALVPDDANGTSDIYLRDRGPTTGVGGLTAAASGGSVQAQGWATFGPATIAAGFDPSTDAGLGARQLGAEVTGASLIQRPELGDLLVRASLAELPGVRGRGRVPGRGGLPGVTWNLTFGAGSVPFELRATWGPLGPSFELWRCEAACVSAGTLAGSIGTTGEEVLAAIPRSMLPASVAVLTDVRLRAGLAEATQACCAQMLDEVRLGDAELGTPNLTLGAAPAGTPGDQVTFGTPAVLTDGRFAGTLHTAPGAHDIWARACLGATCGSSRITVQI